MNNPPLCPQVPQVPTPNTAFGVLNQTGAITGVSSNTPGDKPDFGVWFSRDELVATWEVSTDQSLTEPIFSFHLLDPKLNYAKSGNALFWNIPLRMHRYFNGKLYFKFFAVKPQGQYGGRIAFVHQYSDVAPDPQERDIISEWDLNQSNEHSFALAPFTTVPARQLYPSNHEGGDSQIGLRVPQRETGFGKLSSFVRQQIQPGSLFPPNFDILMFMSFVDISLMTLCDLRSRRSHIFPLEK